MMKGKIACENNLIKIKIEQTGNVLEIYFFDYEVPSH